MPQNVLSALACHLHPGAAASLSWLPSCSPVVQWERDGGLPLPPSLAPPTVYLPFRSRGDVWCGGLEEDGGPLAKVWKAQSWLTAGSPASFSKSDLGRQLEGVSHSLLFPPQELLGWTGRRWEQTQGLLSWHLGLC